MKLEMMQFLLVLVSALHLYEQKNQFLCLTPTVTIVKVFTFQMVLLEFRSIKALNLFIMKYYGKNYDSTFTLQYDIQYVKVKISETAAQNVLGSLK